MKITMEFDTREDGEDYVQLITNVGGVRSLIRQFENYLRSQVKHIDDPVNWPDPEQIRDRWYEIKSECGVVTE